MAKIDFRTDHLKHYIRQNLWLPACRTQKRKIKRTKKLPIKYFTFCASEAIDVFMLVREGIINRSQETGRLEDVFFCEKEEDTFGKIAALIGSPAQGFLGDFDKIVLFEDDADTLDKDPYEDSEEYYTQAIRDKLKIKDAHIRLKNAFPFDIINLDICGVMFPPRKGVITPLLDSIMQILKWQTESYFPYEDPKIKKKCDQFTLFLTAHIDPDLTDKVAIEQLKNRLTDNIVSNETFRATFSSKYGHTDASRLQEGNFPEFFSIAFPKFIINHALNKLGWNVAYEPIYLFDRPDLYKPKKNYQMMHSVSVYQRIPNFAQSLDVPSLTSYIDAVNQLMKNDIKRIEIEENSKEARLLKQDLQEIIDFRDGENPR